MKTLRRYSPAKLNLILEVLGRRPDGFHELRTIFERIDLADEITLKSNRSGRIRVICRHPHVPKGHKNLTVKAAQQLRQDFSILEGVDIHIIKKIPVAAGLGGGSSNAATVLLGLNQLWGLDLKQDQLMFYALGLGSDVPFFLHNISYGLGSGRGDIIKPVDCRTKLWHVLVTPRVKMYTKEVFGRLTAPKLKLTNKIDNVNILLPFLEQGRSERLGEALCNDLEPAILSLRPGFVSLKKNMLDAGAAGVCFSGSGPSIFALAQSQKHAYSIRAKLDRRYTQVFVVSTL